MEVVSGSEGSPLPDINTAASVKDKTFLSATNMSKTGKGNTFMSAKTDAQSHQDGKEFAKYFEDKIVNQARGGTTVADPVEPSSLTKMPKRKRHEHMDQASSVQEVAKNVQKLVSFCRMQRDHLADIKRE